MQYLAWRLPAGDSQGRRAGGRSTHVLHPLHPQLQRSVDPAEQRLLAHKVVLCSSEGK